MTTEFRFASQVPAVAIWLDVLRHGGPRPTLTVCPECFMHRGRSVQAVSLVFPMSTIVLCLGRPTPGYGMVWCGHSEAGAS